MITKIVYALVSHYSDIYAEQAFLSIHTLRKHTPGAKVVIVMDHLTYSTMTGTRSKLLSAADELKVFDLPENLSPKVRSRLVKTSTRQNVAGPMLYIDTDTLIMRDISSIDRYIDMEASLRGVPDYHVAFDDPSMPYNFRNLEEERAQSLGFSLENCRYFFNGGVAFSKDDAIAHEFYRKWHENYLRGLKCGIDSDQPSYAQTNMSLGQPMLPMDDVFNVQYRCGVEWWDTAAIYHYFVSAKETEQYYCILQYPHLFYDMKRNFEITPEIEACIGHPMDSIDFISTARMTLHNHPKTERILQNLLKWLYTKRRGLKRNY